jgi:hypothetical protein
VALLSHGSLGEMDRVEVGFPPLLMSLFRERGNKIKELINLIALASISSRLYAHNKMASFG